MKKFQVKAWDKVEKQMLTVGLWDQRDLTFYNLRNGDFERSYDEHYELHNNKPECSQPWGSPDDLILLQYTNHVDMKGDRLCEGDIVNYDDEQYVVINEFSCFFLLAEDHKIPLYMVANFKTELCGNVFEHPHLLKTHLEVF